MPSAVASHILIARQPILDVAQRVYGYELLYRAPVAHAASPTEMASRVINDALLGIGLETLTGGKRAFFNIDEQVLLADACALLPPDGVVVELLESVTVTDEVTAACESLRKRGYRLALDDFVPGSPAEALVPLATYVKLDVLALSPAEVHDTTTRLVERGVKVLAEKVETTDVLAYSRDAGCTLFQGYYFCKPANVTGRSIDVSQTGRLRLVAALNQSSVDMRTIEELLKRDAALTYRVLRSVNSAAFGLRRQVSSIREALLLLGLDQIRKWSTVWALASLNRGSSEVVTMAVVRARCCEMVGREMKQPDQGSAYFLMGLCSLLDVLLDCPMQAAIEDLPLEDEIRGALLGQENTAHAALDLVVAYEHGSWDAVGQSAAALGLDSQEMAAIYSDALSWALGVTRQAA